MSQHTKSALISDIHGNLPALLAVIADAKKQGVTQWLFLGDYMEDFPWPNEVVDTIKSLDNAIIVRGNKEDYLTNMLGENQSEWVFEQYAPMYWNYRELTKENLEYLIFLPKSANLLLGNNETLYMTHSLQTFCPLAHKIQALHSSWYLQKMCEAAFTHEEYLQSVYHAILSTPDTKKELSALPAGIYAFGHNHLQSHWEYNNTLFIDPGSCGLPLEYDAGAAFVKAQYMILEQTNENEHRFFECRVEYDVAETIKGLRNSRLYEQAPVWSSIIVRSLQTGGDIISWFFKHVATVADEHGQPGFPVSNELWHYAASTFVDPTL